MNEIDKVKNKLSKLIMEMENVILKANINNRENLLDYKIDSLRNINITYCKTCGKAFIPKIGNVNQSYCGYDCLYRSTKETRKYRVSTDIKFRKIDNLRKAIYERRYRASRDGRILAHEAIYVETLENLIVLRKNQNKMSDKEFNEIFDNLYLIYKQASKSENVL